MSSENTARTPATISSDGEIVTSHQQYCSVESGSASRTICFCINRNDDWVGKGQLGHQAHSNERQTLYDLPHAVSPGLPDF
jgi:hypothetical protein